jgi:hypothetical protein
MNPETTEKLKAQEEKKLGYKNKLNFFIWPRFIWI